MHLDDARRARATARAVPADAGGPWAALHASWTAGSRAAEPAAPTAARLPGLRPQVLDSFLLGAGAADGAAGAPEGLLRAGTRLGLLRSGPNRVEVRLPGGGAIGRLPSEDAEVVAELLHAGPRATARVRAVVPGLRRGRVHLAIELDPEGG